MMHGIMKTWFEMEAEQDGSAINHEFVNEHVNNYEELKKTVERQTWEEIAERFRHQPGTNRRACRAAGKIRKCCDGLGIFGLTMHKHATDNISQVCNLALLRGWLGRKNNGLMPLRGHSSAGIR